MTRPLTVNGVSTEVLDRIERHQRETMERCRKRGRHDEHGARALGMRLMEEDPAGGQRYIYNCKVCHGWHVTRHPQPPYYAADYFVQVARPQRPNISGTVRCPDCGEPGLVWGGHANAAYLFSPKSGRHFCRVAVANDFEKV